MSYSPDIVFFMVDQLSARWLDWVEKEHPQHYNNVLATIWATGIPKWERYGAEEWPKNTPFAYTLPFSEEVSQTSWITQRAAEF